jgi:hypothetical protein
MRTKKFWWTVFCAWIVFIGVDFLFHASILESLWKEEIASFKPVKDLFILIPVGYLSFFLLTLLVGYAFSKSFPKPPNRKEAVTFAIIFGVLYAVGNLCALYSFVDIPWLHLVVFHLVYFVEICAVVYIFYRSVLDWQNKKLIGRSLLAFFVLIFIGIVIQNLF